MHVAVKGHALPVFKKIRIASLLCIFETTILLEEFLCRWNYFFELLDLAYHFI